MLSLRKEPFQAPPGHVITRLPDLKAHFSIETLGAYSTNPILRRLTENHAEGISPLKTLTLERAHVKLSELGSPGKEDVLDATSGASKFSQEGSWHDAWNTQIDHPGGLVTWDQIGRDPQTWVSPFLSDQKVAIFEALQAQLVNCRTTVLFSASELSQCLAFNIIGNSSALHVWDSTKEVFTIKETGLPFSFKVEGFTVATSESTIGCFLQFGALLRRLELFTQTCIDGKANKNIHSLAHCLRIIITQLRSQIIELQPSRHLLHSWFDLEDHFEVLESLCSLCHRTINLSPPYPGFPDTREELISHIYRHLRNKITSSAPRHVIAVSAFILQETTTHWLNDVSQAIGLAPCPLSIATSTTRPSNALPSREEEDDEDEIRIIFPTFIPKASAEQIRRAQKSLKLLRDARPDHPLCSGLGEQHRDSYPSGWVWTDDDIELVTGKLESYILRMKRSIAFWRRGIRRLEYGNRDPAPIFTLELTHKREGGVSRKAQGYRPQLLDLARFDLAPGSHLPNSTEQLKNTSSSLLLQKLLAKFPTQLPASTPTLPHLTRLAIVNPLMTHAHLLSSSLLDLLFFDMHFLAHLDLLKRFLLMGDYRFAANLREALFDETDDPQPVGQGKRARTRAKLKLDDKRDRGVASSGKDWGIGLSLGLSEREEWPPGGSELSISLRQVIVDALNINVDALSWDDDKSENGMDDLAMVNQEAEWRMGFLLRDVEDIDNSGRAKWMNPMALEALDFLTLRYKPPQTLGVLITPDIMSKYQRVFTFLLQLLRVDSVARMLFRSTVKQSKTLLSCSPHSQRILQQLQYQLQSFIFALKTYIFDCAIDHYWSDFIARLAQLHSGGSGGWNDAVGGSSDSSLDAVQGIEEDDFHRFADVFTVEAFHSVTLDKILTACLLKSKHKPIGDILKECMGVVLELGMIVRWMTRDDFSSEETPRRLIALQGRWHKSMHSLTKMLRALDERGIVRQPQDDENEPFLRPAVDEMLGPGALLMKIDPLGWYSHADRGL